jgi:hypothetical protein
VIIVGDIAELMLDGTLCQCCGSVMEDLIPTDGGNILKDAPGYPRTCSDCAPKKKKRKHSKK